MSEQKLPTEQQLESTFEVLAWLSERVAKDLYSNRRTALREVRDAIKEEVDKCLRET